MRSLVPTYLVSLLRYHTKNDTTQTRSLHTSFLERGRGRPSESIAKP